jgi:predicted amidohydrolase YtcJ
VLKVSVAPTGVLIAGKSTDLVILDQDFTKVDPSTIRDIPVRATWLDSKRRLQLDA